MKGGDERGPEGERLREDATSEWKREREEERGREEEEEVRLKTKRERRKEGPRRDERMRGRSVAAWVP